MVADPLVSEGPDAGGRASPPSNRADIFALGPYEEAIARVFQHREEFFAGNNLRRHAILACLAAYVDRRRKGQAWPPDMPDVLRRGGVREIIRIRFGISPPQGLEGALGKILDQVWKPASYRALAALLESDRSAKSIWHAPYLSEDQIQTCMALPRELRDFDLARTGTPALARRALEALARKRVTEPEWAEQVCKEVRLKQLRHLLRVIAALERPEFVHWPCRDSGSLVVIATEREMFQARLRFRNCLSAEHWAEVVAHRAYYLEWRGDQPALVELRHGSDGWRLGQCRGIGNAPLRPEVFEDIEIELRRQAVLANVSFRTTRPGE